MRAASSDATEPLTTLAGTPLLKLGSIDELQELLKVAASNDELSRQESLAACDTASTAVDVTSAGGKASEPETVKGDMAVVTGDGDADGR